MTIITHVMGVVGLAEDLASIVPPSFSLCETDQGSGRMSYAHNGETRLYYEAFGRKGAPAVLLLNGAGRQAIDFAADFCQALVGGGYRVLRFDSRDVGFSTAFSDRPAGLVEAYEAVRAGRPAQLVYDLADMARDALAILDAEGERAAHWLGRSLGGMAAQWTAIHHPERVLSLTLIMASSRGAASSFTADYLARLETETFADEAAFVERQLRTAKVIGSPAHLDLVRIEGEARAAFQRGVHDGAIARHFAVSLAAPDLRAALARVTAPTLVIHGALDPLIPLDLARETAAAIPGARLEVFEDMAHDAPPAHWTRWARLFLDHAAG